MSRVLNGMHGWRLPGRVGWSPETYGRWLDLAHSLAHKESEQTGTYVRADAVEMAHFSCGRDLARKRLANAVR